MPDTYISQFSGEEIDAALRAAQIISGASTLAELRKKLEIRGDTIPVSATDPTPISEALTTSGGGINPNLLDNWYFGRPVNQRGQMEYTGNATYSIDRWWTQYETTLSIVDGGIKVGGKWDVQQYFETTLPNATYTLSLLYKDRTGSDPLRLLAGNRTDGDIAQTESKDASGILSVTFSTAALNRFNFGFAGSTDNSATIIAIKLEFGNTQTLAHKEGDKWVLNEIPDFGEQLRRCQWYHREIERSNYGMFALGMSTSATEIDFIIPLNPPMRVAPSVSFEGSFATNGVSFNSISSLGVVESYPDEITLRATGSGFVRGEERTLQVASAATSKIIISAEL